MPDTEDPILDALSITAKAQQFEDPDVAESYTAAEFIRFCGDLDKMSAIDIAHLYSHVKLQFDQLDAARNEMSSFIELIKNVKLPAAFDREQVKTFTLRDGTRVTKSERTFASIIGPQPDAYTWLEANGLGSLVKPSVNSSALSSAAKAILGNKVVDKETGMVKRADASLPLDLPDELFRVEIRPTTSITRPKGAA